jgi:hypothetical protein
VLPISSPALCRPFKAAASAGWGRTIIFWKSALPSRGAMTAGDRQQIGTVREISLVDTRHRHRTAGRAGAGRIGRLCARRGVGLDYRARPAADRRQSVLWYDRGSHADRHVHQLCRYRSNQGVALGWVLNGVVAVPLMVVIMTMATQKRVMGRSLCRGRSGQWAGCRPR